MSRKEVASYKRYYGTNLSTHEKIIEINGAISIGSSFSSPCFSPWFPPLESFSLLTICPFCAESPVLVSTVFWYNCKYYICANMSACLPYYDLWYIFTRWTFSIQLFGSFNMMTVVLIFAFAQRTVYEELMNGAHKFGADTIYLQFVQVRFAIRTFESVFSTGTPNRNDQRLRSTDAISVLNAFRARTSNRTILIFATLHQYPGIFRMFLARRNYGG